MIINADTKLIVEKLTVPAFSQKLARKLEEIITFSQTEDALLFAANLTQAFKDYPSFVLDYPDIYEKVREMIVRASWVALSLLKEDDVVEMFGKHLTAIFSMSDYYLEDSFRARLLFIFPLDIRDEFKKRVKEALERNAEKLTQKDIEVNGRLLPPTVGNWILAYRSILGNEVISLIKVTEYLFTDTNTKSLPPEDKKKVEQVIKFYEKLKLSSLTLEGLEEAIPIDDEGHQGNIIGGVFQPLKFDENKINTIIAVREKALASLNLGGQKEESLSSFTPTPVSTKPTVKEEEGVKEDKLSETDSIREKLNKTAAENEPLLKQISAEESNIVSASKGEFEKLKNYFFDAYRDKEPNVAAACLIILARTGELKNIISDPFVQEIFEKEIFPILIKQKPGVDPKVLADNFRQNKEDSIYLKIFLKFVLSRILPEGDQSAYVAWQLENIFRALKQDSYLGLVYYNIGTSQVEWAMVNLNDDGSLVME
ncbi:MAG: hypothetical protein ABIH38_03175 [Patescibacteria group bacterium]